MRLVWELWHTHVRLTYTTRNLKVTINQYQWRKNGSTAYWCGSESIIWWLGSGSCKIGSKPNLLIKNNHRKNKIFSDGSGQPIKGGSGSAALDKEPILCLLNEFYILCWVSNEKSWNENLRIFLSLTFNNQSNIKISLSKKQNWRDFKFCYIHL